MEYIEYQSFSDSDTESIGYSLGSKAKLGEIYCLIGDIGTGKTVFSKGFAKGLNIQEMITSPTFTLVNEYELSIGLFYHFDVYRIYDEDEMDAIGFDDYLSEQSIVLIEWADIIKGLIPKNATWINIEKDLKKNEIYRKITIENLKGAIHENTSNR